MAYIKRKITVELLYDDAITDDQNLSLEHINYEITEGCMSGNVIIGPKIKLTKVKMRTALIDQGSDPEFLMGTHS